MVIKALTRLSLLLPDSQLSGLRNLELHPIGLALPPSLPPVNGLACSFRRQLAYVLLSYGKDPLDPAEPVIEIQTSPAGGENYEPPSVRSLLTRAEQPNRPLTLAHSSAWEADQEAAPHDEFATTRRTILVETTERQVAVVSRGRSEALRFRHGDQVVTVLGRPGIPLQLALQPIDDLEPFITAGKQFRRNLAEALRSGTFGGPT